MNLSVGILTYSSPITLHNTLESYKESGLLDIIDDIYCVIQPSSKSEQELAVCEYYGIRSILEEDNGMMAWGIKRVYTEAKHDYVLFLENDFRCLYTKDTQKKILEYSIDVLSRGEADIIRLRSLKRAGHPIQAKSFIGKENDKIYSSQLYLCTHYLDHPEKDYPEYISLKQEDPMVYMMSSKNCVYTNNPAITSKAFFTENILPYIEFGKELEPQIDVDWREKYNHRIYITQGIFTHVRLDGHERKYCWCCPVKYGGASDTSSCSCCMGQLYNPQPFNKEDLLNELL